MTGLGCEFRAIVELSMTIHETDGAREIGPSDTVIVGPPGARIFEPTGFC